MGGAPRRAGDGTSPRAPDRGVTREMLGSLRDELATEMRARFARDLPFEELLFDRWERARSLGWGERTSVYQTCYVFGDVRVGADCWIGPMTLLDGSAGLVIGDHTDVSAGTQVYTHSTVRRALSEGREPIESGPVRIGSACHIGAGVVILPGVTIGDHSVIGAGAVVNRDVPSWTVAAGVPARPIGRVEIGPDGLVRLGYAREERA